MQQQAGTPKSRGTDDVRFIGALAGCYAFSERRADDEQTIPVHACRLQSISPLQAVLVAAVFPELDETIALHVKEFGLLRGRVTRILRTGFAMTFELDDAARKKLGAKIAWRKKHAGATKADKREFARILPRNPRTVLTMADGTLWPCFVIDVSQSGVAVSAAILPGQGTPVAVGSLVGRVVRRLDVGFAVQFLEQQPAEQLERLLLEPPRAKPAAAA
jgi:hypothetical protein